MYGTTTTPGPKETTRRINSISTSNLYWRKPPPTVLKQYINFASATDITAGVLPFSSNPKDLADAVNPLLYKYLKDHPTKRYGIIPMDFPELEKYLITRILDCSYDNPILLPRAINKATGIGYLSFGQQLYHVPNPSVAENIFSKGSNPQLLPCFNFDVASSTVLKNGKLIKFNGRNEIYLSMKGKTD